MRWLVPHFAVTELAPEDVILHKVHSVLVADSKLLGIFGFDGIQKVDFVNRLDFSRFPMLMLTTNALDETPAPGVLLDKVTIYLVLRFELLANKSLDPDEPTIATLFRHLARTLTATGAKQLNHVVNGTSVQLVRRSNPGPLTLSRPDQDPEGGRFAQNAILPWEYELNVDVATQRIRNVVTAGG